MLIYKLQQWFHIEPLLILNTINPRPTFRPESLYKISFPSHAAATGPPSRKRLERSLPPSGSRHSHHRQDPIIVTAAIMPGPLRRRLRPRVGTSLTQLSYPLHQCHHRSTTQEQGALVRKRPDLTPLCRIAALMQTDADPHIDLACSTAIHR
jgi:hypothetical protein